MKSVLEFYSKPTKKKQPDVFVGEHDILLMIEADQDGENKKRGLVSVFHQSMFAQNEIKEQEDGKYTTNIITCQNEATILNNGSTKKFMIIKNKASILPKRKEKK